MTPTGWSEVAEGVLARHESCVVYALPDARRGTLFVNAPGGGWLQGLDGFPAPWSVLCTHYFRDHCAGAAEAARRGATVIVPWIEREVFADPVQHFRERESYIAYDNIWDSFAPIEATQGVRGVHDHQTLELAGHRVTALPLPGVTPGHTGYEIELRDGTRAIFAGEAIHSHGRMLRIAPLQYNYNDLGGAVNAYYSSRELSAREPALLLPSVGPPLRGTATIEAALSALRESLRALCAGRPEESAMIARAGEDSLTRVSDHVYRSTQAFSDCWFLLSDSGRVLAIDYGYHDPTAGAWTIAGEACQWPLYARPARRRALLHSLAPLRELTGAERIDVVLVSHFHDDHVSGIPQLQRLHGTACWAPENVTALLEQPYAHRFPCDWPEPIAVHRSLALGEPFSWEEHELTLHAMSGHTRFSALICFEADGLRYAHSGDQYFMRGGPPAAEDWSRAQILENHVYRNGAMSDAYAHSAKLMLDWRPDVVLSGHYEPMWTDESFFAIVERWGEQFTARHRASMVLEPDEAHFGLDSWGGWLWPYRVLLAEPGSAVVTATLRNPHPAEAELSVRLVGPDGWRGEPVSVRAGARAEVSVELSIEVPQACRRQPIAAELYVDGLPYGQVCEALVSVGERF